MNSISPVFNAQTSQICKGDGIATVLHTSHGHCLWAKDGFRTLFRIPNINKNLLIFLRYVPTSLYDIYIPNMWKYLLVKGKVVPVLN
jgi:hypothetical protein